MMSSFIRLFFKNHFQIIILSFTCWMLCCVNIESVKFAETINSLSLIGESLPFATLNFNVIVSTLSTVVLFLLLSSLGFFDLYRLIPRKSDFFLVLASVAATVLLQKILFSLFFGISITTLSQAITSTLIISGVVFSGHYLFSLIVAKSGFKKKIVLDVLPEERDMIIKDFETLGDAFQYITFLSKNELREYILRAEEKEIDLVIISREVHKHFEVDATLIRAHLAGIAVIDQSEVAMTLPGRIRLSHTEGWTYLLAAIPQTKLIRTFTAVKSIFEPLIALVLGIIFLPVILILAIVVKKTSKGPIFYKQVRTGHLGKNFTLVKFRSMYTDAEVNGPQWSKDNDSRITPIGKFMRDTRLDELPQLWNVMKGEMGFFGPRPERPEIYRELKKEIPLFSLRTVVKPGITGWAQVCAGYAASVEESKTKLEFDLFYIQNLSPRLDLIILIKTIQVALFGEKKVVLPHALNKGHINGQVSVEIVNGGGSIIGSSTEGNMSVVDTLDIGAIERVSS
jgi:exopolysaccharide biosynthesis polyprenyl glycosylphosphotransferase